MGLTKAIRALFHRHEFFQVIGTMEPCGVTLGWDARPTPEYRILERCRCGQERWCSGWQLPRSVENFRAASQSPGAPQ